MSDLHRRKSSREDDIGDVLTIAVTAPNDADPIPAPARKPVISSPDPPNVNGLNGADAYASSVPRRQRVLSTPAHPAPPTLYSPVRSSFGSAVPRSPSHMRTSFSGHARSPSASAFYPPAAPSPLSMSFPPPSPTDPPLPSPHRHAPPPPVPPQDHHNRRRSHARIHSRNLSIYFPRPGSGAPASIAEDGAQELEIPKEAPETLIASAPLQQGRDSVSGFRFGGKSPSVPVENGQAERHVPPASAGGAPRASRRGHHHKHSLSHNFFSFMEPETSMTTSSPAPTPGPASASFPSSPWQPMTPLTSATPQHAAPELHVPASHRPAPWPAILAAVAQFVLGSALWVRGQQCGSLACTGLGYWVVFDAFGVVCARVLPAYLLAQSSSRLYGNARIETLAVFAQSLYLVFAAVYVSKEAVEHMLLAHGEGHHHHRGDDTDLGIELPTLLIATTLLSLAGTGIFFDNNARLIDAAVNRIPSLSSLIQSTPALTPLPPPTSPFARAASSPYTALPLATALVVLTLPGLVPPSSHRSADLLLASALAGLTLSLAYPTALALAKVLLQTAPARGAVGGRMEAFLRAMRDIERHPQVVHLPPPHIWQLTAGEDRGSTATGTLVVTLELHVRGDADDAAVLALTRWAWERCVGALGGDRKGGAGGAEVTVGVVRG